MEQERGYDIVLFGATGFVGELAARYLAGAAPSGLRWAIAGRSRDKLELLRAKLATIDPALDALPLIVADSGDTADVRALAESTRVLATTVGPFVLYGEPLVAACAAAGTDYLDLTGEPEFVDTTYVRHHETAVASGARLVHACGFDSIPSDLGTYYTVLKLPEDVPITISGYVQMSAAISGGTFASVLTGFSRGRANVAAARERRRLAQRSQQTDRDARAVSGRPHRAELTHGWALPFPAVDAQIVARSARGDERYGPRFRYSHFLSLPRLSTAVATGAAVPGVFALANVAPARRALQRRVPQGSGPSEAKRAKSWFRLTFVADADGQRLATRVSGGDPGYDETARMFGEAALALACDELPATAGQVTTANALGQALLDRLVRAGLRFEVLADG